MPAAHAKTADSAPAPSAAFRDKWIDAHTTREGDVYRLHQWQASRTPKPVSTPITPLDPTLSARSGLSLGQIVVFSLALIGLGVWAYKDALGLSNVVYWFLWLSFIAGAGMRLWCSHIKPARPARDPYLSAHNENLPPYSVIVALYRESAVVAQLIAALRALDYPKDRLDIILALETGDDETLKALGALELPPYMRILIVPDGRPRTKPRALNYALAEAKGAFVVVYDAEDMPHPQQLREAVNIFCHSDTTLACLQAPLRPLGGAGFVARQFAAEYAVQFEVVLPAFSALCLPLPLGGTSNHFRASALKNAGGWDAWNVTEDADLGMRLGRMGYDCAMLSRPTYETAPTDTRTWIPQRTRWIKGYIQTLIVHTRTLWPLNQRLLTSLALGVGLSALSALAYAPFMLLMIARLLLSFLSNEPANMAWLDLFLLTVGVIAGMVALSEGAKRSLTPFGSLDMLMAPLYWCLTSIAAVFALGQLLTKPFHWDKTEHQPLEQEAHPVV